MNGSKGRRISLPFRWLKGQTNQTTLSALLTPHVALSSRAPSVSSRRKPNSRSALPFEPIAGTSPPRRARRSESSTTSREHRQSSGSPGEMRHAPRQPFLALAFGLRPRSHRDLRSRGFSFLPGMLAHATVRATVLAAPISRCAPWIGCNTSVPFSLSSPAFAASFRYDTLISRGVWPGCGVP